MDRVRSISMSTTPVLRFLSWLVLVALLVSLAALAGCSPQAPAAAPTAAPGAQAPAAPAGKAPRQIKISLSVAATSPYTLGVKAFNDRVQKRIGNVLDFVPYPANQLGSDRQSIEGMRAHTLEGGFSGNVGGDPVWDLTSGPYLFRDRDHLWKVMRGEIGSQWRDYFLKATGIRMVDNAYFAPRHITSGTRAIRTPDDLNGFKIRVPDQPTYVSTFRLLGANPVPIAFGELYTALQSKTVDGQENPLDIIVTSGFTEVQKYITLSGHMMSTMQFMLDDQVWQSFTPDQQKVISEEARTMVNEIETNIVNQEQDYLKKIKDAGMEIIEPDRTPFMEKTRPFWRTEAVTKAWGPELYDKIQSIK